MRNRRYKEKGALAMALKQEPCAPQQQGGGTEDCENTRTAPPSPLPTRFAKSLSNRPEGSSRAGRLSSGPLIKAEAGR